MLAERIRETLSRHVSGERRQQLKSFASRYRWMHRFFRSDLVSLAILHQTDKWGGYHDYVLHYQRHFQPIRHRRLNLLEIGVGGYDDPKQGGQSLRMWKDFFPNANIFAIDVYDKAALEEPRIRIFQGSQADADFLKRVAGEIGRLDIVIDDGSHVNEHVILSFQTLFPLLAEGGIYAIEDLHTAYQSAFGGSPDLTCPSTSIAMCKHMIDGLNWEQIPNYESSYFDQHIVSLHCSRTLAVIYKGFNKQRVDTQK